MVKRLDAWPTRAQLRPGEPLELLIDASDPMTVGVRLTDGETTVAQTEVSVAGPGRIRTTVSLPRGIGSGAGYGIEVRGGEGLRATTAVDIAAHWSAAPRYGFFSDFDPGETPEESARRADALLKLHINVVQFYDWMVSHHTLVSPTDEFTDPLGRRLSHAVARRKVELVHERGIAALGYGALYGAEAEFSQAHADWLLYDGERRPLSLAGLFFLQDFAEGSPWRTWILDQYALAVDRLGFDGIHIDQYGTPKWALSRAAGDWRRIDVGAAFPGFVEEAARLLRDRRPEGGSIFNCVNAWPLDGMVAVASDAATYIEVWEPSTRYRDLYELVRRARLLRPDKQVILAAYLQPFAPDVLRTGGALTAFRLASAAIGASGGFHLIAGEGQALLTEAYYPRYGRLDDAEAAVVRRYFDFTVRNTALLHGPAAPDIAWTHVGPTNDLILLDHPNLQTYGAGAQVGSLWVIGHERGDLTVLQLINLRGLSIDAWNSPQERLPSPLVDVEVRVRIVGGIAGVWWDTPDDEIGLARSVAHEVANTAAGRLLVFRVPRIDVWSTVWWRATDETDRS